MRIALATIALAACSIPDKHPGASADGPGPGDAGNGHDAAAPPVDGPASGPFACLGQPLPTTAPATVTVSGVVSEITTSGTQVMSGAMLGLYPAEGEVVTNTTSDSQGKYSMTVPTAGAPFDGFVLANGAGELQTYVFPSRPFDSNTPLAVTMITQQTLTLASQLANVTVNASSAQLAIVIVDCNGTPLAGATLTAASGTVRYASSGLPSVDATSTDATGEVFVFNVPPGGFTVSGKDANGDTLRSHVVAAVGATLTVALLQP